MAKDSSIVPAERIERSILLIRGHKVMLGCPTLQGGQRLCRSKPLSPARYARGVVSTMTLMIPCFG